MAIKFQTTYFCQNKIAHDGDGQPKLLLFDIDGTLINAAGVGSRALKKAMRRLFDVDESFFHVKMDGLIDNQIIRIMLEQAGVISPTQTPADAQKYDSIVPSVFRAYLEILHDEIHAPAHKENASILPGVLPMLNRLDQQENIYLALLSGNIRRGAQLKLAPFDLNRYFLFGAFGEEGKTREELVAVAIYRAMQIIGILFRQSDIYIIGDSVRDVQCARPYGIRTISVATGGTRSAELEKEMPDLLLQDLTDIETFTNFVLFDR
jgi:phosphoglycolate phosphatase-like HAD superfamily hydrolase